MGLVSQCDNCGATKPYGTKRPMWFKLVYEPPVPSTVLLIADEEIREACSAQCLHEIAIPIERDVSAFWRDVDKRKEEKE